MKLESLNPASGELIAAYDEMSAEQVNDGLVGCHNAFLQWRRTHFSDRAELLTRVAGLLRERRDELAALMTHEMGKPITQARAEVDKCAWVCDYYAENAEAFLSKEIIETDAAKSYISFEPLGVVLAVGLFMVGIVDIAGVVDVTPAGLISGLLDSVQAEPAPLAGPVLISVLWIFGLTGLAVARFQRRDL